MFMTISLDLFYNIFIQSAFFYWFLSEQDKESLHFLSHPFFSYDLKSAWFYGGQDKRFFFFFCTNWDLETDETLKKCNNVYNIITKNKKSFRL